MTQQQQSNQQHIPIAYNKRLTFIGKTGSGKSFLAWSLLGLLLAKIKGLQVIIVDPKHEHTHFGGGESLDKPKLVQKYEEDTRVQVIQVWNWTAALDDLVAKSFERGKVIVVFQELGGLATSRVIPDGMTKLCTQGRGKGVGAWFMIQSVKKYPTVVKQQTEIFFVFRITDANDRKEVLAYVPDVRVAETRLPKRFFWVFVDDWDSAVLFQPIVVSKRKQPK